MIYVMSDIHGNAIRFNSIMEQIDLQPEDTLYVLGDVIDRYPDGIRILRLLMSMPNVQMLLGNHEYMMLNALDRLAKDNPEYPHALRLWYRNGGDITHEYIKHIRKSVRKEIFDYLHSLPLNIDIEPYAGCRPWDNGCGKPHPQSIPILPPDGDRHISSGLLCWYSDVGV